MRSSNPNFSQKAILGVIVRIESGLRREKGKKPV